MLFDFIIENKTAALQFNGDKWQTIVKKSVDLLVDAGCAEPRYYQSILESVEENGPYFVIAPGIAMPHARPEGGALKTGFSLVTLKTPISFGHKSNDPVDFILTICASDKKALNEEVIVEVMDLFDNDDLMNQIRQAKSTEDLEKIFKSI